MSSTLFIRCKSYLFLLLVSFFLISLFSCAVPNVEITTSGFEPVADSNWLKYFTNDPRDYQESYIYPLENSEETPFTSLEVKVKKNSGYAYADYGIAFCIDNNSYLAFVIDTMGNYSVIKSVNRFATDVVPWTESPYLNKGYNVENTLKAVQITDGEFEIYINNTSVNTFTENSQKSGSSGYFVYIASENSEDFGSAPVEVLYEK